MRRFHPAAVGLAAAGLLLILLLLVLLLRKDPAATEAATKSAARNEAATFDKKCASQRTYDLIKRDLFRQAARIRGSDNAAFGQLAAYSVARVERPLVTSGDAAKGTIACSGQLSLDLPPGVEVVGGRRTLSADIEYSLQPAADGSGDVVLIKDADPIVVPLATLARVRDSAPLQQRPSAPSATVPTVIPAPPPQQTAPIDIAPPATPQVNARPSFDCRAARSRSEIAVCRNDGLAALDRQMAAQYQRAVASAGAREWSLLRSSRDTFLRYRDQCRTNDCIANSYRGRMREIDDIMAGRWQPRRG